MCVNWLLGRGLSISCNLLWAVPLEWRETPREEKINRIKTALRKEMDKPSIDCTVIRSLFVLLSAHTNQGWRHRFITTNWDYLLQREILNLRLSVLPSWLANSHVFHLNGTIENLPDNSNRSPFLLEEDSGTQRMNTVEANIVYNQMIWNRHFVVVGMSFECETDQFLLKALGRVEDDLPIGESSWIVVNPNTTALNESCQRIAHVLPHASVTPVSATLNDWLQSGTQELRKWEHLSFNFQSRSPE